MKKFAQFLVVISLLSVTFKPASPVEAAPETQAASASGALCLPGVYTYDPGDCLASGPSAYRSRMAQEGIHLPVAPLSSSPIDPSLGAVNVSYAEVVNMPAPVFGSSDEASSGGKKGSARTLNGNFVYVSYTDMIETGGRKLYQVEGGQWMTGNYLSRVGAISQSIGVTFESTPAVDFGWALTFFTQNGYLETQRLPGYTNAVFTGHRLGLYELTPVFAERDVDGELWYMLGPDEWVAAKYVARVRTNPVPPAGISGDRWIEVNLFDQSLAVYDQRRLVYATVIASGADPFWTQPGVFQIFQRHETTPMMGMMSSSEEAYYLEDVPWTMYYDGARALHGAYWRTKMGFVQSHGCVNMTVGDAHWLYNWAQDGDWVYVWDPSGKTPTDPSLYSSGGF